MGKGPEFPQQRGTECRSQLLHLAPSVVAELSCYVKFSMAKAPPGAQTSNLQEGEKPALHLPLAGFLKRHSFTDLFARRGGLIHLLEIHEADG